MYNFSEILKNRNFFDEKKSLTFKSQSCSKRERYYNYDEYDIAISEDTCPSFDLIYLYNDYNLKNKIELRNEPFDLVRNIKDNITGILGLHYLRDNRMTIGFLNLLKKII